MPARAVLMAVAACAMLAGCETNVYVTGDGSGPSSPDDSGGGNGGGGDGGGNGGGGNGGGGGGNGGGDGDGGGGSTPDTPDDDLDIDPSDPLAADIQDMRGDFDAAAGRLEDLDATGAAAMPVSGAATYKGTAEMGLGDATLYGEARVRADFDDGTLSGGIDDIIGVVGGGAVQTFEGDFDLDELDTDGAGSPTATMTATGEIEGSGGTIITLDATLEGQFLGEAGEAVRIDTLAGSTGSIDGREVGADLVIWTEQVWRGP